MPDLGVKLKNICRYETCPIKIDRNSEAITEMTKGEKGIGTKIFVRWNHDHSELTSLEVTYETKSKLTYNCRQKIVFLSNGINNFQLRK